MTETWQSEYAVLCTQYNDLLRLHRRPSHEAVREAHTRLVAFRETHYANDGGAAYDTGWQVKHLSRGKKKC